MLDMAIECNGFRTQTVLELFPMQNSSKWEFISYFIMHL